jgi:Serine aminopeptidase, S33
MTIVGRMKRLALSGSARVGNGIYAALSAARRSSLQNMIRNHPESFVITPERVEAQTAHRLGPTLQHVVEEIKGSRPKLEDILKVIDKGLESGLFDNYGEAIFINPHRVGDLLVALSIPADKKDAFIADASKHYLLREYIHANQAKGYFGSKILSYTRGTYIRRIYMDLTRDGKLLSLTRVVNQDRVKTNDNRPSVLTIPGVACNHQTFDLNEHESFALGQCDKGRWTYLFDPRGLGKNKGDFDPHCFFDTLVSNDLPAAIDFIYNRPSQKKPVVLIGHSMGGLIAEFMLIRQAYKLRLVIERMNQLSNQNDFTTKGKTREEIRDFLDRTETGKDNGGETTGEIRSLTAEAYTHFEILNGIKGVITLGSPKTFDKNRHPVWPLLLNLNLVLPFLQAKEVPVDIGKWIISKAPKLAKLIRPLINPSNFKDADAFLADFAGGTDSFPLGVGLQFLIAIYSGKGMRRMSQDKFNYSAHLDELPVDIPISHFYGTDDILAPPFNAAFVDHSHPLKGSIDLSRFPQYPHQGRVVHQLDLKTDPQLVDITSPVNAFVVDGVGHLDFLYGKRAQRVIVPLINRLVDQIWQS